MRGTLTIQFQVDIGNGASCAVTDASDPMDIDPVTEAPAILASEQGLTEIVRVGMRTDRLTWTARTAAGEAAVVSWETV